MSRLTLVAATMLAACASDPTVDDVFRDANSEVTTCAPGAYKGAINDFTSCSEPCAELAPINPDQLPPGVSCFSDDYAAYDARRWFEIDGFVGVCGASSAFGDERVRWVPCAGQ